MVSKSIDKFNPKFVLKNLSKKNPKNPEIFMFILLCGTSEGFMKGLTFQLIFSLVWDQDRKGLGCLRFDKSTNKVPIEIYLNNFRYEVLVSSLKLITIALQVL